MHLEDETGQTRDVPVVPVDWLKDAYEKLPDVRWKINRAVLENSPEIIPTVEKYSLLPKGFKENPVGAYLAFRLALSGGYDLSSNHTRKEGLPVLARCFKGFNKSYNDFMKYYELTPEKLTSMIFEGECSKYPLFQETSASLHAFSWGLHASNDKDQSPVVRGIEKVLATGDLDKILQHLGPYCMRDKKETRYLTELGKEKEHTGSR